MRLNDLGPADGSKREHKRRGRGAGSGLGKTGGRGVKGQRARAGGYHKVGFEGGQMPLQRRVPKRGFRNPFRVEHQIVNVAALESLEESELTLDVLAAHRLVDLGDRRPVKLLGNGEITRKVTVEAHATSASARAKIEAAGGTVELIGG
jgi:large subunit ribosomal protein L15